LASTDREEDRRAFLWGEDEEGREEEEEEEGANLFLLSRDSSSLALAVASWREGGREGAREGGREDMEGVRMDATSHMARKEGREGGREGGGEGGRAHLDHASREVRHACHVDAVGL